jgi:DNA invertase Pin-like site-specific DNA recombinase
MRTAIIYIRKRGHSPHTTVPGQRRACHSKAALLGAKVVEEFKDIGFSARELDRPGVVGLLARLRGQRDLDYVIVQTLDRVARSVPDCLRIERAIEEAGARFVVAGNIEATGERKPL